MLGAGIAFGLGRILGQDALRPLLRARWLKAADGQLSRHGFRTMMMARLFPGVPFWAANYCAAVSRMGWLPFLLATALGSIPNTAAYAVAGARASAPTSPAFLIAMGFIALPALVAPSWPGASVTTCADADTTVPGRPRTPPTARDPGPARTAPTGPGYGTCTDSADRPGSRGLYPAGKPLRATPSAPRYIASSTIALARPPASHIVCSP